MDNNSAKIAVLGVGGGGCNAVEFMKNEAEKDEKSVFKNSNVKIIAANTDVQVLEDINGVELLQLGPKLTKGLGAGGDPVVGRKSAEESTIEIASSFEGYNMIFVTTGMGGGTGTGASPIIAGIAKRAQILTVGIVTKPFRFEGKQKMRKAEAGINELKEQVDTLIVIPNDALLGIAEATSSVGEMFNRPNTILMNAVKGISELIIEKGIQNIDFTDVKNNMQDMGLGVIGFGQATGDHAALTAVKDALSDPLMKNYTIDGAKRMLAYIKVPKNYPMVEYYEAADYLENRINSDESDYYKIGLYENQNPDDLNVSVLIISEAREAENTDTELPESLKEFKKVQKEDQTNMFDEKSGMVNDEFIVELQQTLVVNEGNDGMPSESKNADSELKNMKDEEYDELISLAEQVPLPENSIDQNDLNIPTFIRQQAAEKEKEKNYQSSIQFCFSK